MKDHSIFLTRRTSSIMAVLLLSASLMIVSVDLSDDTAEGATSIGSITVSGSNTRTYTNVDYLLDGNIEVSGTGSSLVFESSTITLSQDVGSDGELGGGDDHIYHIQVTGGGSLEFKDSILTTQTDQLHPYFWIDITVSGSGSTLIFEDSLVEGPGSIVISSSGDLQVSGTSFIELRDQSDLSYDIDGDGSSSDDVDYNDDGMSFELNSAATGLIQDSELRDTFSFNVPSRDGLQAGNITLDGSGTNLTVINSFLDMDLQSNLSTGSHNILKISDGAVAHLVGASINDSSSSSSPAIVVEDSSSQAVYYRWIAANVLDGMDVQIEDHGISIYRVEGSTDSELNGGYLTSEMIDYMDRTPQTWNDTDELGWAFIPVITDVFTYDSMPNSDVTPDFKVRVSAGTEVIAKRTSFRSYPDLPDHGDQEDLFSKVILGDAVDQLILSDLSGEMTFSKYIIDPSTSTFFNDLDIYMTVTQKTTISGTGAMVGGTFYPSYYAIDGHLKVSGNGHLIINDTTVDFLTDDGACYILVEDGGKVELNNVSLKSTGSEDLYLYVLGSSTPTFSMIEGSLDLGHMVGRDTASFYVESTSIDTSVNLYGSSVSSYFEARTIDLDEVYSVSNSLDLSGGLVAIGDLEWSDVDFSSTDAVFDIPLEIDGTASLTNVSYSGNETPWLSATGNGVIEVSYWTKALVVDSVENPLPGSTIEVDRIVGENSILVLSLDTDENGMAVFPLLQEEIRSSGRTFLGNYRLSASFRGYSSSPYSTSFIGSDIDAKITIPGGPNIVPGTMMVNGTLISGNNVVLLANVTNIGEFDSGSFNVAIKLDGLEIGLKPVNGLMSGETKWLEFPWECQEGDLEFLVVVDPENELNETVETDNVFAQLNSIGLGPDYEVLIVDNELEWVYGMRGSFDVIIKNIGEEDPSMSPILLDVGWSAIGDGGQVADDIDVGYLSPGESVRITLNWTPTLAGEVMIAAFVDSQFDRTPMNSEYQMIVIVKTLPDIIIKDGSFMVDSPVPVTVNTTVTIEIELVNMGEIPATPFRVAVYDLTMDDVEPVVQPIPVDGIIPGESHSISFPWYAGSPIGLHDIRFVIDVNDEVNEQDEENNNYTFPIMVDTPPDIVITSKTGVDPSVVTEGQNMTIWAEVENIGNTMGRDVIVHIAIDSDTNLLRSFTLDLYPGQKRNLTVYWDAEGVGERRIFIVVDPFDRIIEEGNGESNNDAYIDFLVLSRPDLTMEENDLRVLPEGMIHIDDTVTLYATIRNSGQTEAKNAFIRFYGGDPDLGGKLIPYSDTQPSIVLDSIPAEDAVQIEVPWTPRTGGYHEVFVVLDLSDLIDEGDESNNKMSWMIYVQTLPDLTITNISMYQGDVEVNSAGVDKELTINITVSNIGDTPAPSFKISFHNGDFVNDPLSTKLGGDIIFPTSLIQGGSFRYIEYKWKVTYPKGIRTLYATIEILDGREQTISNNQMGDQLEIFDIEDVPELNPEMDSLTLSSTFRDMSPSDTGIGYSGTNISVILNITNNGGKASPNTTIEFWVSNSTDTWLEYSTYIEFIADNSTDVVVGYWMLGSIGMNTLKVIIDPENMVREFDEGNNIYETTIEIQEAPDLYIELIEEDSKGWETDKFVMTKGSEYIVVYDITNTGNFTYNDVEVTFTGPAINSHKTVTIPAYGTQRVTFTVKPEIIYSTVIPWTCKVNEGKGFYESNDGNNEAMADFSIVEEEEEPSYLFLILFVLLILILIIAGAGLFVYKRLQTSEMAKCSNCSGLVALDAIQCPHCGVEFSDELECECGEPIPKGSTECPSCGKPVSVLGGAIPTAEEAEEDGSEGSEEGTEPDTDGSEEMVLEELDEELDEVIEEDVPAKGAESDEELAECFECGALIPVAAPICPHCGAVFE